MPTEVPRGQLNSVLSDMSIVCRTHVSNLQTSNLQRVRKEWKTENQWKKQVVIDDFYYIKNNFVVLWGNLGANQFESHKKRKGKDGLFFEN